MKTNKQRSFKNLLPMSLLCRLEGMLSIDKQTNKQTNKKTDRQTNTNKRKKVIAYKSISDRSIADTLPDTLPDFTSNVKSGMISQLKTSFLEILPSSTLEGANKETCVPRCCLT